MPRRMSNSIHRSYSPAKNVTSISRRSKLIGGSLIVEICSDVESGQCWSWMDMYGARSYCITLNSDPGTLAYRIAGHNSIDNFGT